MPKKKFAMIFIMFVAVLVCMIFLPSVLFEISDYTLSRQIKTEEFDFIHKKSDKKILSTEERLRLILHEDNDNIAIIDNSSAFDETQQQKIFKRMCKELKYIQDLGACPEFDVSDFDMVTFYIYAYTDMLDPERYVKAVYIAAKDGDSIFQVMMDLETEKIYYYSIYEIDSFNKLDVLSVIDTFAIYLGLSCDIIDYKVYKTSGEYTVSLGSGIEYIVFYNNNNINFTLMQK